MTKIAARILAAICLALTVLAAGGAYAQTSPGLVKGQVPTAADWNSYFASKVDYNIGGCAISAGCTGATTVGGAVQALGLNGVVVANIPSLSLGANRTIVTVGYKTAFDRGFGGVYTSVGATSSGWGAIQDADGVWFNLVLTGGTSDPGWFGAPGDDGATTITSGDISAHPEWRGTYTAGTRWDDVGTQEAIYAAFANASTPGVIVWNNVAANYAVNRKLVVKPGTYGLGITHLIQAAFAAIEFNSFGAIWDWKGDTTLPMINANSLAHSDVVRMHLQSTQRAQPNTEAPLLRLNHDGSAVGLATQNLNFDHFFCSVSYNGACVSISEAGNAAQGSTITFNTPQFVGSASDYALWAKGSNALNIVLCNPDVQGFVHYGIKSQAASIGMPCGGSFENQQGVNSSSGNTLSPQVSQLTTLGADFYAEASGGGASGVHDLKGPLRSESSIAAFIQGQATVIDGWQTTAVDGSAGWFGNLPFLLGQPIAGTGSGSNVHTFMAVGDGGPVTVGPGNGGWGVVGAGSTDCTISDPTQAWTVNAYVGKTLWFRFTNGFTTHQTAAITANTATTVTISPCFSAGTVVVGDTYHIGGQSSGSTPTWSGATNGHFHPGQGLQTGQGFFVTAGTPKIGFGSAISPMNVGDFIVVPNGDRVTNGGTTLPSALYGKVSAICIAGACGNLAVVTGNITSVTMVVTAVSSGKLMAGGAISGAGITGAPTIQSQSLGKTGLSCDADPLDCDGTTGTYFISTSQTVGSITITETAPAGLSVATIDRTPGVSVFGKGGYWGTPLTDGDISWLDIPFNAFYDVMTLRNSIAGRGVMTGILNMVNSGAPGRTDFNQGAGPATTGFAPGTTQNTTNGPDQKNGVALANSPGVTDLTSALAQGDNLTMTASGAYTLNAPLPAVSSTARAINLRIASIGVAQTVTFGTNFCTSGALTTDGNASSVYNVGFHTNGTCWAETYRSGPNRGSPSTPAGGTSGQIQYNASGFLGGYTASGDETVNTSTGVVTVTKLNGVSPGALYPLGAGVGLQINGSNLQDLGGGPTAVLSPSGTTLTLANSDCGSQVSGISASGTLTVTLPASPPAGCVFYFNQQANSIVINPNGQTLRIGGLSYTTGLTLANTIGTLGASFLQKINYTGNSWSGQGGAPTGLELSPGQLQASVDQIAAHGQVRLSLNGSTLQLCPFGGPGGLIISHAMRIVPKCNGSTAFGAPLPAAATTSNSVNYIYALNITATISSADNTGCNGRLTVGNLTGMNANTLITIFGLTNTTEANGTFLIASNDGVNHICLTGITFTHTGADAGNIAGVGLVAATTGHVTDQASVSNGADDSVEVQSTNGARTLVGIVYVGASNALNDSATKRDVLSWFNRQPKKLIVQDANGRTWAAGTIGTFKTPTGGVVEGELVVAGPPTLPGTDPANAVDWTAQGSIGQTAGSAFGVGVGFFTAAQSANASVASPELEAVSATSTSTTGGTPFTVRGVAGGLAEGRQFIDLAGWATTNTATLSTIAPGVTLEAVVQQ